MIKISDTGSRPDITPTTSPTATEAESATNICVPLIIINISNAGTTNIISPFGLAATSDATVVPS